jgi:hypothetical protein
MQDAVLSRHGEAAQQYIAQQWNVPRHNTVILAAEYPVESVRQMQQT